MKLLSVGISNFRSIGEEPVHVRLDKKINILMGPNNAGKSNVIKALVWLHRKTHHDDTQLDQLDQHKQAASNSFGVELKALVENGDGLKPLAGTEIALVLRLTDNRLVCTRHPLAGLPWHHVKEALEHKGLGRYYREPGAGQVEESLSQLSMAFADQLLKQIPEIRLVPQFRQMRDGGFDIDGSGAVNQLAAWLRPSPGHHEDMSRFREIQALLRDLLHEDAIEIDVDHTNTTIMVTNAGLRLPLDSYGTGLHELIILAIAVFSKQGVLFCIEEPEIHLHPRLQKEFLRFLADETQNKYVLTTHSPALLGMSEEVSVTHVWSQDGVTRATPVQAPADALKALADLGVSATDILQANSVIWVEGPSDRIYLNQWLSLEAPELREGIEYCIMFYGGRLLSHLSLKRGDCLPCGFPRPEDLVPLLRMNQHSIIVMDSDKDEPRARLNKSKGRVRNECRESHVVCWITHGREIENYLPAEAVAQAYEEATGTTPTRLQFGLYDRLEDCLRNAFGGKAGRKVYYDNAKPEMARKIVQHVRKESMAPHLLKDLRRTIAAIRAANG